MTAIDQARTNLEAACQTFNRCATSTTPPGVLQKAVMDLTYAVNQWAELSRSEA